MEKAVYNIINDLNFYYPEMRQKIQKEQEY